MGAVNRLQFRVADEIRPALSKERKREIRKSNRGVVRAVRRKHLAKLAHRARLSVLPKWAWQLIFGSITKRKSFPKLDRKPLDRWGRGVLNLLTDTSKGLKLAMPAITSRDIELISEDSEKEKKDKPRMWKPKGETKESAGATHLRSTAEIRPEYRGSPRFNDSLIRDV